MTEFLTKTFDNFLSEQEIKTILEYAKKTENWRKIPNSFWDGRTINLSAIEQSDVYQIIENFLFKVQKTLEKEYSIPSTPYADTIDLVRWLPGMSQSPHCDDMSDSDRNEFFAHRYFGTVLCINDNYTGGRTYYPEHNFEVIPKAGTLVVHLGDCNHRHGVTKVENEIRYTLASFWTLNKNKALNFVNWH